MSKKVSKSKGCLYIAYGSNLNLQQMHKRCPDAVVMGNSKLHNHRLRFVGGIGSSVANAERAKGCSVPVLVWRISPSDEKALDRYEGFPHLYRKEKRFVKLAGKQVKVMVYIMNTSLPYGTPHSLYYETIREGYISAGFDTAILDEAVSSSSMGFLTGGNVMDVRIKEQILAIRDSGETNMLDANAVQYIANREGYYELVIYIEEHRREYVNFIFHGDGGEE